MVASTTILYPEPWASLSALSESTILARDTPVTLDSPSMRERLLVEYPAAPHTHTAHAWVSLLWLIPSIGASLAWHHNCMADLVLRDLIVMGVKCVETRKKLISTKKLTLSMAIDICWAAEATAHWMESLSQNAEVHTFRQKNPRTKPPRRPRPGHYSVALSMKECKFCGMMHEMVKSKCPAYGRSCSKCHGKLTWSTTLTVILNGFMLSTHQMGGNWNTGCWLARIVPPLWPSKSIQEPVWTPSPKGHAPRKLQHTSSKLIMWNGALMDPLGKCRLVLKNPRTSKYNVEFVVVKEDHLPLLGLSTAQKMGLITVEESNMERVCTVSSTLTSTDPVLSQYKEASEGDLGDLPGSATLTPHAIPVPMPDRRTPISIRPDLKQELNRLEKLGVITKITEPTPWISQMVITKKKSGALRVCIDPKELNMALIRERFTIPILEDGVHELGKSAFFTKVDLKSGYWHVKVDQQADHLPDLLWTIPLDKAALRSECVDRNIPAPHPGIPGRAGWSDMHRWWYHHTWHWWGNPWQESPWLPSQMCRCGHQT